MWGGPEGFGAFLDLLADIALGDQSVRSKAREVRQAFVQQLEADYDNGFDAYFGNQCADTEYPSTFFEFRTIDVYARAGSRFGPFWWWFNNRCADWPVAPDRYIRPWTARTSAPVLVVGNFFDGVTDYAGAVASSKLLRNARLLSYAGWGHGVRAERMHERVHRPVPGGRHASAGRHRVPGEAEPVPRGGDIAGGVADGSRRRTTAELDAPTAAQVLETAVAELVDLAQKRRRVVDQRGRAGAPCKIG